MPDPDLPSTARRLATALADHYRFVRELGAGGMARVYLARDLKHDRDVAVKVLHPELAAIIGGRRFLNEIKVTAHLHHPHILPLHDSGEVDGLIYYITPYVEGESLRHRLNRERQLPVADAVRVGCEIASALDYAHRHGVIHRDIKPENILLHDGRALVADFGIALAVSAAGERRMTETGLAIGTPQYMSPEQATAEREITAKSDVYSLGCVLYEMLAGEPPFTGPTVHAILGRILTEEPRPLDARRKAVPAHVSAAAARALEKLPADRFASAADFAAALEGRHAGDPYRVAPAHTAASSAGRSMRAVFLATIVALTALIGYLAFTNSRDRIGGPERWSFALPDSAPLAFVGQATLGLGQRALALSPDGTLLVYAGQRGATTALYLHTIGTFDARLLPGSDGAFHPFFSPDGKWIAFFTQSRLKTIAVATGSPNVLAQVVEPMGGTWAEDGRILVANNHGFDIAVFSASGGPAQKTLPVRASVHSLQLLPDGRSLLIEMGVPGVLAVISIESGAVRRLDRTGGVPDTVVTGNFVYGSSPIFLKSGRLVYVNPTNNVLLAVGFDPKSLRLRGQSVPILEGLRVETAGIQYDIAATGLLAFAPGRNALAGRLVWASRAGNLDTLPLSEAVYGQPAIAPSGNLLAIPVLTPEGSSELRLYDLTDLGRGVQAQWRYRRTSNLPLAPRWTPDGAAVLVPGLPSLKLSLPLGSSIDTISGRTVTEITPDGRHAVGFSIGPEWDLRFATITTGDTSAVWIRRPGQQAMPRVSPDGRWLAYASTETGQGEIWVEPFPPTGGRRTKVSISGGEEPVWSPKGDRLFYRYLDTWYVVQVNTLTGRVAKPERFISGSFLNVPGFSYDVSADGERLLLIHGPSETTGSEIRFIRNFGQQGRRQ